MDHPARRHLSGARRHGIPEVDRSQLVALVLDDPPAGPDDCASYAATVLEVAVRGIRDCVDLELRDVRLLNLDLRQEDLLLAASCQ
jgi:hypothetical protein